MLHFCGINVHFTGVRISNFFWDKTIRISQNWHFHAKGRSAVPMMVAIFLSNSRGGGILGSVFAGYVPLASPDPYPIIVYSVANYGPYVSHFWANIPQIPTCRNLLTPEIPQMCAPRNSNSISS